MSNEVLKSIIGQHIESASHDVDSNSWLIKFGGGSSLNIECMWRLLEEGVITSTSYDHGQFFGNEKPFNGEAALNEMAEHEIVSVDSHVETGDVNIKLGEYFILQIIPTSAGYESWQFKDTNGSSIVASSGQFHTF